MNGLMNAVKLRGDTHAALFSRNAAQRDAKLAGGETNAPTGSNSLLSVRVALKHVPNFQESPAKFRLIPKR